MPSLRHEGPLPYDSYKRAVYVLGSAQTGGTWVWKETNCFASMEAAQQRREDMYADMADVKVFTLYVQER